jgi:hypothetical protein
MIDISYLIENLSEKDFKLIDCLMQTKVFLYRIGRKDLVDWVNNEINGYSNNDSALIPSYRVVSAQVKGNVNNGAYMYSSHPLPTMHLTEKQRDNLTNIRLHQSVGVLESFIIQESGSLQSPLALESGQLFDKVLDGGYKVQQCWCEIDKGQIQQTVIEIRSRLLDFLLELNNIVSTENEEEKLKTIFQSDEVTSLFSNAIFGDNTTILIGNHNKQHVEISIAVGDFDTLAKKLIEAGLSKDDTQSLKKAIDADTSCPEHKQKQFGQAVKSWMREMLDKAMYATWQIELGVAGGLLTSLIQRYYGW